MIPSYYIMIQSIRGKIKIMVIVGELINTSRKAIKPAVENKDAVFIKELTKKQVAEINSITAKVILIKLMH